MNKKDMTIHDLILEMKEIRARVDSEKKQGKKKPNKSKLNYLFSKKTTLQIKELASNDVFDGVHTESDIARAAMRIGIKAIVDALDNDPKYASGLIHIQKLRAMFE